MASSNIDSRRYFVRIRKGGKANAATSGTKVGEYGPFTRAQAVQQGQVLADSGILARGCKVSVEPERKKPRRKNPMPGNFIGQRGKRPLNTPVMPGRRKNPEVVKWRQEAGELRGKSPRGASYAVGERSSASGRWGDGFIATYHAPTPSFVNYNLGPKGRALKHDEPIHYFKTAKAAQNAAEAHEKRAARGGSPRRKNPKGSASAAKSLTAFARKQGLPFLVVKADDSLGGAFVAYVTDHPQSSPALIGKPYASFATNLEGERLLRHFGELYGNHGKHGTGRRKNPKAPQRVDMHAARELEVYIANTPEFGLVGERRDRRTGKGYGVPTHRGSIVINAERKRAKGKLDAKKLPKLFLYLVDAAAKEYARENGKPATLTAAKALGMDKPTREYVASELATEYLAEAKGGAYAGLLETWGKGGAVRKKNPPFRCTMPGGVVEGEGTYRRTNTKPGKKGKMVKSIEVYDTLNDRQVQSKRGGMAEFHKMNKRYGAARGEGKRYVVQGLNAQGIIIVDNQGRSGKIRKMTSR